MGCGPERLAGAIFFFFLLEFQMVRIGNSSGDVQGIRWGRRRSTARKPSLVVRVLHIVVTPLAHPSLYSRGPASSVVFMSSVSKLDASEAVAEPVLAPTVEQARHTFAHVFCFVFLFFQILCEHDRCCCCCNCQLDAVRTRFGQAFN